jgi:hypothetical protein
MLARARTTRAAILSLLLGLVLIAFVATPPVDAAGGTGVAFGAIEFPQKDNPGIKVLWFTKDWTYLGTKTAAGGTYSLNLEPGSYHLQFVDQRPSYMTEKYAPTDISVVVRAGHRAHTNVTMKKGAFITGTVKTHGKIAKKARVVAANQNETSFDTTANKLGQFAIGGLPEGKYSLFTYDDKHAYVGKSTYAGKLTTGGSANVAINLTTKAGSLRVYMFTTANGNRKAVSGNPVVTAVSKATGQFWSAKVTGGNVVFQGLYPGKYQLVANGFGVWFGRTGAIEGANVKAGKPDFGTFTYTKRGGWITGTIVDDGAPSSPVVPQGTAVGADIRLIDTTGATIAQTTSGASGNFTLSGPLTTEGDLSIVVDPSQSSDGYMVGGDGTCHFDTTTQTGFSVTTGIETEAGDVPVARTPGQTCH